MCDKAYQHSHQKLDHEGDRRLDDVNGIHEVRDRKSKGSADSAVDASEDQGAQYAECVAEMYSYFIACDRRDWD